LLAFGVVLIVVGFGLAGGSLVAVVMGAISDDGTSNADVNARSAHGRRHERERGPAGASSIATPVTNADALAA
jgi:hypothetical protein